MELESCNRTVISGVARFAHVIDLVGLSSSFHTVISARVVMDIEPELDPGKLWLTESCLPATGISSRKTHENQTIFDGAVFCSL